MDKNDEQVDALTQFVEWHVQRAERRVNDVIQKQADLFWLARSRGMQRYLEWVDIEIEELQARHAGWMFSCGVCWS